MATRRPIVLVSGISSELPVGDVIDTGLDVTLQPNPSGLYFTGDNKLGFDGQGDNIQVIASGVGAVYRTVQDKGRDIVSVKDFGAVGDGVTDDTAAIQAAITQIGSINGGIVFFPAGTYLISSALNLSSTGICLVGSSRWGSLLKQTNLSSKILNITGNFCSVKSLSFIYSGGTPLSGAIAIYVTSSYVSLEDFIVRSSYVGVHYSGSSAVAGKITNFEILDYEQSGIKANSLNDLFVSKFILNAGNSSRGTLGGIRLEDKVEAFICSDGDILLGAYSITMEASVFGVGTRPAYNNFTNVFFDSAVNPALVTKCVETEFIGCWFSNGRSGGGAPGATVSNSDSLRFTNCRFFNCGGNGCTVQNTAKNTTFTSCDFSSNSYTSGSGISHGLQFADSTYSFQVINCKASNNLFSGIQDYGVFIGTNCSGYTVVGNNVLNNNKSPGLLDAGSRPKTLYGNIGFRNVNSGSVSIPSGTTSAFVAHDLSFTPNISDILLTRSSSNAGSVDLYASSVTSSGFTVNTAPAPFAPITVVWSARARES